MRNAILLAFLFFLGHKIVYDIYNLTFAMTSISLQQERAAILQEMAGIDQMIRGHVSEQSFAVTRHGKTVIQGPYYILQRREEGKNNCQRVPEPELDAIVAAVESHQRFQTLAAHLPQTAACLSKLLAATSSIGNLAALEKDLLEALKKDGARLLEQALNDPDLPLANNQRLPGEEDFGLRSKGVLCLLGPLHLRRHYFYDARRGEGRFPLDQALGLVGAACGASGPPKIMQGP